MAASHIMCPSHRCKPGSHLLGIRQDDGTVALLPQTLPVDDAFVAAVQADPLHAEQRFRFTNKCIEGGCGQWTGKGCGVVEKVVQFLDQLPVSEALPPCGIRTRCRWFLQKGGDACKICPYILTEITEADMLAAGAIETTTA